MAVVCQSEMTASTGGSCIVHSAVGYERNSPSRQAILIGTPINSDRLIGGSLLYIRPVLPRQPRNACTNTRVD